MRIKYWKYVLLVMAISGTGPASPAESRPQTETFASQVGLQSGRFYCKGMSLESAIEKGTMSASLAMDLPMSQIDSMDLSSDEAGMALIEGILSSAIDDCPQRAKKIFREFSTLGN